MCSELKNHSTESLVQSRNSFCPNGTLVAVPKAIVVSHYRDDRGPRVQVIDNRSGSLQLQPMQDRLEGVEEDFSGEERGQGGVDGDILGRCFAVFLCPSTLLLFQTPLAVGKELVG